MESWLFPNVPLIRLGTHGPADNQELNYIERCCARGVDAVATMHHHWNSYIADDLLNASEPPARLAALKAAGVSVIRIPVGWWAFEAPTYRTCDGGEFSPDSPPSYLTPGMTADGFVTGGCVYLLALLRWLHVLGMRAVIDMHSLPGGAVKNMGYTGRHFDEARFFDGSIEWHADGNASSLPPSRFPLLRRGVEALLRLATFCAALDELEETAGVLQGIAPWNEALFSDDAKAALLLPPFVLALLPLLREVLPASRYEIYLNWFNQGLDWAAWMHQNAAELGSQVYSVQCT